MSMKEQIKSFEMYLIEEEKSTATVEKYLRDVRAFAFFWESVYLVRVRSLLIRKP